MGWPFYLASTLSDDTSSVHYNTIVVLCAKEGLGMRLARGMQSLESWNREYYLCQSTKTLFNSLGEQLIAV